MRPPLRKKIFIISHIDLDGVASAAIEREKCEEKVGAENVYLFFADYPFLEEKFFHLMELKKRMPYQNVNLHILDLSYNDEYESIVQEMLVLFKEVVWVDHHEGSRKREGKITETGVKCHFNGSCTSRICYGLLGRRDDVLWRLASLAQISDHPDSFCSIGEKDYADKLDRVLAFINYDFGDMRRGTGIPFDWEMDAFAREITRFKDVFKENDFVNQRRAWQLDRMSLALEEEKGNIEMREINVSGRLFLIGAFPHIFQFKVLRGVVREEYLKPEVDCLLAVVGPPVNNTLALKDPESDFPIQDFCHFMKGGGRDLGGGFINNLVADEDGRVDYESYTKELKERLEKFLSL